MKNLVKWRYGYRLAAFFTASAVAMAAPVNAFAATKDHPDDNYTDNADVQIRDYKKDMSPEFAYSEDKWAALRDNVMEYEELADLIHEYNPTVRSNRSSYNDLKGKSSNDISLELMDDAQDVWDDAEDMKDLANDLKDMLDSTSYMPQLAAVAGSYGTALLGAANLNFSGNTLEKMADNNFEDADMEKIKYDQTEANLVYQAQQLMATYEQAQYNMETLLSAKENMQKAYEDTVARQSVGLATQQNVLDALKQVQDQEASIRSAQKSADNVHRTLCLMLGWQADAQPEIMAVPDPEFDRIDTLDPNSDLEQAYANNYDIRYNEKKLGNLTSADLIESTKASIEDNRNSVASSIKSQYNKILVSRDAYNTAVMNLQVADENLREAEVQRSVGSITDLQYLQIKTTDLSAKNELENVRLQLRLAMETYDWIVKGLTL
ncbi:MAG: TolC family protein [Enterocloster sp.]